MPYYCVNRNAQPNGDHEVHDTGSCVRLPDPSNRLDLGYHMSCQGAVQQAKLYFKQSNGCYYCCSACNTG